MIWALFLAVHLVGSSPRQGVGTLHLLYLRAPNDVPAAVNMEHAGQAQFREEQTPPKRHQNSSHVGGMSSEQLIGRLFFFKLLLVFLIKDASLIAKACADFQRVS